MGGRGLPPLVIRDLAASITVVIEEVPRRVEWAIPAGLMTLVVNTLIHLLAVKPKLQPIPLVA